ncbi:MAG TPA: lmo0937 family membrane protein [Ktedonobacteraceae bacterium]
MSLVISVHTLIWGAIIILAVIWFLGLIGSGRKRFIHLLLVAAVVLIIYNFFLH